MKKKVDRFGLQPVRGFPNGAPQWETWDSDASYNRAVLRYQAAWRNEYECNRCMVPGCPVCDPLGVRPVEGEQ